VNTKGDALTEINDKMIFRLSSRRSPREVKLLHLEWAVVTQLDGEKSVGEIASALTLSENEVQEIFKNLIKEHLLELVSVSESTIYVPEELFDDLERELTVLVGPVAGILLEDTLREMKKDRAKFEKTSLPVIIDLLSNQISDEEKQLEFQKNILKKIKPYII